MFNGERKKIREYYIYKLIQQQKADQEMILNKYEKRKDMVAQKWDFKPVSSGDYENLHSIN